MKESTMIGEVITVLQMQNNSLIEENTSLSMQLASERSTVVRLREEINRLIGAYHFLEIIDEPITIYEIMQKISPPPQEERDKEQE